MRIKDFFFFVYFFIIIPLFRLKKEKNISQFDNTDRILAFNSLTRYRIIIFKDPNIGNNDMILLPINDSRDWWVEKYIPTSKTTNLIHNSS